MAGVGKIVRNPKKQPDLLGFPRPFGDKVADVGQPATATPAPFARPFADKVRPLADAPTTKKTKAKAIEPPATPAPTPPPPASADDLLRESLAGLPEAVRRRRKQIVTAANTLG
ncbi:MAG TPA: hypothetical protein VFO41_12705 [Alphaproteobacteria bacterium]|nr:hypothetical protein [Alphaproteobacteria bacterium]